jgi:hypothetical protein
MTRFVLLAMLCACGSRSAGGTPPHDGSAAIDSAGSGSGSGSDSGSGSGSGGSSTSIDGQTVSCYSQGAPSTTCTLPSHCCFSNFSAQHDGSCSGSTCAWGTVECDGPEDCTNGGHCCSTQLVGQDGIYGYRVACQANACGTPPTGEELCHPNGAACANGGSCITTYGNNNDLPRTLYICR